MAIAGHATAEGTARYRERFVGRAAEGHFRRAAGLWWSSIGIGTYLGAPDDATDDLVAMAVAEVVNGGVNVIDAAINYRFERAERSVGTAMKRLLDSGTAERDELVVCTKGGFLPHPERRVWFEREYAATGESGLSLDDLVADSHCMHPVFLADQLERSRRNLGVETIDVYYVHNPESQRDRVDDATFHGRLEAAFHMLEGAVAEGKIRHYGLATWNAIRVPPENAQHVSLDRTKTLAREAAAGGVDHFDFIQLPLNVRLTEALQAPTQSDGRRARSALLATHDLGIHAITSGSIAQKKFSALEDGVAAKLGPGLESDAQRALQFTRSAPGVTTALVGMKQPHHIAENLALGAVPPLGAAAFAALFDRV